MDSPIGIHGESGNFSRVANVAARTLGSARAFAVAIGIVLLWAIMGPIFHFSDTWQLIINTGTTIITFLMVFVIQNTQNRDSAAIQLKLDEMIRATHGAHNAMLDLERLETKDLDTIRALYQELAEKARTLQGHAADGTPDLPNGRSLLRQRPSSDFPSDGPKKSP